MSERRGPAMQALVIGGGAALLVAVAVDALAVVGRHVGLPLLGSIEIVQAAVLIASSVAIVVATVQRRHAVVHLIVNRLPHHRRGQVARIGSALGAILFACLLAGAIWNAADMIGGHEESELLHIPYAPLRLIEIAALAAVTALFAAQALRRPRP